MKDPISSAEEHAVATALAQRTLAELGKHPLLQPLRDAGAELQIANCGPALRVSAVRPVDGVVEVTSATIGTPEWWVARVPHWPERLAHRLAVQLREQWER